MGQIFLSPNVAVGVAEVTVNVFFRACKGPSPLLPKQLFIESKGICYKGSALEGPLSAPSPVQLSTSEGDEFPSENALKVFKGLSVFLSCLPELVF